MRLIYLDEAGIAATETVTVVAALLMEPDTQWRAALRELYLLAQRAPERYRKGLIFHATELCNGRKYGDGWPWNERRALLLDLMGLPRKLGIGVCAGIVRRELNIPPASDLTLVQTQHLLAFSICIGTVDLIIRDHYAPKELGLAIAEDAPNMQRFLRGSMTRLRNQPLLFDGVVPIGADPPLDFRVTTIIDTIHFVQTSEAVMLQLVDACAFGIRRAYAGLSDGNDYFKAIFGSEYPDARQELGRVCLAPPPRR
jgi:hypothetical protein